MSIQNRRTALKNLVTGAVAVSASGMLTSFAAQPETQMKLKGNVNHSVCRWCYSYLSLDELCKVANEIGLKGIDLVGPKEWPVLQDHKLESTMCNGAEISLTEGWNDKQYHQKLIRNYSEMIPLVAKAGYKNLICFSGNRNGKDDETGLKNSADGLKQIMGLAEQHGVNIVMELLNSKVDHKDYQCDKTWWGADLTRRIGSENFGLLYDIYHMQIDEGDVIRTIRDNHQYIKHYHTAGVPGRHEIDESQELYYPAIMKAIVDTGFKGYVAQEFIPVHNDKIGSLKKAVQICDV
ncbi:MAG TPA: TIM barrel protein [Sphingobacteriaceae bacterium]